MLSNDSLGVACQIAYVGSIHLYDDNSNLSVCIYTEIIKFKSILTMRL